MLRRFCRTFDRVSYEYQECPDQERNVIRSMDDLKKKAEGALKGEKKGSSGSKGSSGKKGSSGSKGKSSGSGADKAKRAAREFLK